MSTTIDQVFSKRYEGEVKAAYQRTGSLLRGTVRTKTGIVGASTHFPTVSAGTTGTKTRHGKVPTMNLGWDQVECTLVDQYAAEWCDELDKLKHNVDEMQQSARAAAFALGRYADGQLIDAMNTATNSTTWTVSSIAAAENSVLETFQGIYDRDVPPDAGVYAAISWRAWTIMMKIPGFVNSDYSGPDLRPFSQGGRALQGKTWMGAHWITHSGLPKTGNNRTNFLYHMDALGHAIGADISTIVSHENTYAAHFINSKQSMGACLIDDDGVQKLVLDESSAVPTS